MQMDGPTASIITDRAIPPEGLGSSPSTLKAVLWCIRGLGAPGADLCIPSSVIETRTCLGRRAVSRAIATLREFGILTQTIAPAPGRAAHYRMNYERLAEWLQDADRSLVQGINERTKDTRSCAPKTRDRAHQKPTIKSSCAPETASCAPEAQSCASQTHDIKEETAYLQKPAAAAGEDQAIAEAERRLAAAAAGIIEGEEDWERIAKSNGIERDLATQLASVIVGMRITDREIGENALERLSERLKGGGVQNPCGLLRSFLGGSEGLERSKKAIARERAVKSNRAKLLQGMTEWPEHFSEAMLSATMSKLESMIGADAVSALFPAGRYLVPLAEWPAMQDFTLRHWHELNTTARSMEAAA